MFLGRKLINNFIFSNNHQYNYTETISSLRRRDYSPIFTSPSATNIIVNWLGVFFPVSPCDFTFWRASQAQSWPNQNYFKIVKHRRKIVLLRTIGPFDLPPCLRQNFIFKALDNKTILGTFRFKTAKATRTSLKKVNLLSFSLYRDSDSISYPLT